MLGDAAVWGEPGAGNAPACVECGAIVNASGTCLNCGLHHSPTLVASLGASMEQVRASTQAMAKTMKGVMARLYGDVVQDERGVVAVPAEREGGNPMGEAGIAMLSAKSAAEAIVRLRLGPDMLVAMEQDLGPERFQEALDYQAREEAATILAQRRATYLRLLPATMRLIYCPECKTPTLPNGNRLQNVCMSGHQLASDTVARDYVLADSVAEGYWREGVTAAIALMVHYAMNSSSDGDYASAASHLQALLSRGRVASQPQQATWRDGNGGERTVSDAASFYIAGAPVAASKPSP